MPSAPTASDRRRRHRIPAPPRLARARRRRRGALRVAVLGLATALLLAVGAGVASAHVTVNPNTVTAGSYAKLTFRVPTESETASTVSVTVSLPTDHPFPSVSVMQMPGWTPTVHQRTFDPPLKQGRFTLTDAVDSITWTADDKAGIPPGEFAEFAISAGPVPDVPSMSFPAVQTYSDGSVVRWDQPQTAGGGEPQHPVPLLTITPAGSAATSGAGSAATSGAGSGPTVTGTDQPGGSAVTVSSSDGTARILAVAALVLAGVALLIAAVGVRRRGPARSGRAASGPPSPPDRSSPPDGTDRSSPPEAIT